MKVLIIMSCWILVGINALSQSSVHQTLLSAPVLIKLNNGRTGSGFIISNTAQSKIYLITARHVLCEVKNKSVQFKGDVAELTIYNQNPNENPENSKIKIDLINSFKAKELIIHNSYDVCAVYLGSKRNSIISYSKNVTKNKNSILYYQPPSIAKKYNEVLTGNDIYTFGFPTSIGIKKNPQIDYEIPLLRKGIIAGKNNKLNTIIIDCPVYPGNSGGPVVMVSKFGSSSSEFSIIGIVTEWIPYEEMWINSKTGQTNSEVSNSGYAVVVPIDRIFEMIN